MLLIPQSNSLTGSQWAKNRDVALTEPELPSSRLCWVASIPSSPAPAGFFFLLRNCSPCAMTGLARCQICSSISSESRTMLAQHYALWHPAAFTCSCLMRFFPKHVKSAIPTTASSLPPTFPPVKASSATCIIFFQALALPTVSLYKHVGVQKEKINQLAFI